LITLSNDVSKQEAIDWIAAQDYDFTEWGWDPDSVIFYVWNDYNYDDNSIPQTFIIDNDGNLRYCKVGEISNPLEFTNVIDELI
jgi:hypothetical protein